MFKENSKLGQPLKSAPLVDSIKLYQLPKERMTSATALEKSHIKNSITAEHRRSLKNPSKKLVQYRVNLL